MFVIGMLPTFPSCVVDQDIPFPLVDRKVIPIFPKRHHCPIDFPWKDGLIDWNIDIMGQYNQILVRIVENFSIAT